MVFGNPIVREMKSVQFWEHIFFQNELIHVVVLQVQFFKRSEIRQIMHPDLVVG